MNDRLRLPRDDASPATRGELRALERVVDDVRSEARRDVDQLRHELRGIGSGVERHIDAVLPAAVERAVNAAVAPIEADVGTMRAQLGELVTEAKASRAILLEQEVRAKIAAERRAEEEARELVREAKHRRWTALLTIMIPVVLALVAVWQAAIASRTGAP